MRKEKRKQQCAIEGDEKRKIGTEIAQQVEKLTYRLTYLNLL